MLNVHSKLRHKIRNRVALYTTTAGQKNTAFCSLLLVQDISFDYIFDQWAYKKYFDLIISTIGLIFLSFFSLALCVTLGLDLFVSLAHLLSKEIFIGTISPFKKMISHPVRMAII